MKLRKEMVATILLLLPLPGIAGWKDACTTDIGKFCKQVHGSDAMVAKCLDENSEKLEYGCRQRGMALYRKLISAETTCQEDITKFCETIAPGEGSRIRCLRENSGKLSRTCQSVLDTLKQDGV